jgi:hypothetical protein
MIGDLPDEFRGPAERIRTGLIDTLGEQLTGIYLYGSVLDSSFVPLRSDLDLIAVTESELTQEDLSRVGAWFAGELAEDPAFERIQVSFLIRDRVLQDDPGACLYQFGSLSRSGSDGNPIIWLDFFRRGRVLHGVEPREFLPEVSDDVLHAALEREVGYLREEISLNPESKWRDRGSYRAYAVLTLCRILYSHETRSVASKSEAAAWVKQSMDREDPIGRDRGVDRAGGSGAS